MKKVPLGEYDDNYSLKILSLRDPVIGRQVEDTIAVGVPPRAEKFAQGVVFIQDIGGISLRGLHQPARGVVRFHGRDDGVGAVTGPLRHDDIAEHVRGGPRPARGGRGADAHERPLRPVRVHPVVVVLRDLRRAGHGLHAAVAIIRCHREYFQDEFIIIFDKNDTTQ